jgi:hypothetical protein
MVKPGLSVTRICLIRVKEQKFQINYNPKKKYI